MTRVRTGLGVLRDEGFARLRGRRVGLVCHPASIDADFAHAADLLKAAPGVRLVRLFGPEHGIRGEAQDMESVEDGVEGATHSHIDPRTGAPVVSLYGHDAASLRPRREHLADLDVLIVDLQDIGTRYYTFAATLGLCLEACAGTGVEVMVLDRPNPLDGATTEGGSVRPGFESFVGQYRVAVRHGLTMGEYGRFVRADLRLDVALSVVGMSGWRRAMAFEETGLPWVLPSPNMPTVDTAWVYPGMCLVEGTALSEARGTTRPFELVGAPWLDAWKFADALASEGLPGVVFRPAPYRPTFHKYAGRTCGGVQLHVTDRARFQPLRAGWAVLRAAWALGGRGKAPSADVGFAWRTQAYEFVRDIPAIDLLAGSAEPRRVLEAGGTLAELCAPWADEEAAWNDVRAPHLLY